MPFFLSSFSSGAPQAGLAMKPKRSLDVMKTEVGMLFKMEKAQVTPVSLVLPRKGGQFHEDAFPPTHAGVPSLEGEAWASGDTANPTLKSQKPGEGVLAAGAAPVKKKSGMAARVEELTAEVAALKAENAELKAALAAGGVAAPAPAAAAAPAAAEPAAEPAAAVEEDDDEPAE